MRLSSAPDWAPPALPDPAWLPDLNARDALLAAAAALAWPTPNRTRAGLNTPLHPVTTAAWAARIAIEAGEPAKAMRNIVGILEAVPKWPGGWKLAADAHAAMGKDAEAAQCVARIDLRQMAASR
jgi:predicted Zn-dependent protease